MDNLYVSSDVLQFVNILLNALIAVVALAITTYAGAKSWAIIRAAWRVVRGYVNDPTDKAVEWLAEKTGVPAKAISDFLTHAGDAVVAAAPAPVTPDQEHAEPGALGG